MTGVLVSTINQFPQSTPLPVYKHVLLKRLDSPKSPNNIFSPLALMLSSHADCLGVFFALVVRYLSLRFLPPPQYDGSEWNFFSVAHYIEKKRIDPHSNPLLLWIIHGLDSGAFPLELLSTKEVVPKKTAECLSCGLLRVTGALFSEIPFVVELFKCNVFQYF